MNAFESSGGGRARLDRTDLELLGTLGDIYDVLDPMPAFLPDMVLFALAAADLDGEVARLVDAESTPVGARAAAEVEVARRITFSSAHLTVMISVESTGPGEFRVDGWAAPGASLAVAVRAGDRLLHTECDETGRFSLQAVPAGPVQFTLTPTAGSDPAITVAVLTPALHL